MTTFSFLLSAVVLISDFAGIIASCFIVELNATFPLLLLHFALHFKSAEALSVSVEIDMAERYNYSSGIYLKERLL